MFVVFAILDGGQAIQSSFKYLESEILLQISNCFGDFIGLKSEADVPLQCFAVDSYVTKSSQTNFKFACGDVEDHMHYDEDECTVSAKAAL